MRRPIPTWFFVLVIVRQGDRFLVVHERQHGQRWYLPAGRVEPGEALTQAAQRETLEESRVSIVLDGIVRVEHTPIFDGSARCRVIYLAHAAADSARPGSTEDSLDAAWVTLQQLDSLELRGREVHELFHYVARGGPVYPLSLLTPEGAPLV